MKVLSLLKRLSQSAGEWPRSNTESAAQVVREMEKNRGGVRAVALKLIRPDVREMERFQ